MKQIIKQNMQLFIILMLGLCISLLLGFLIFYKNNQRLDSIERFLQLKSKIDMLYSSKPSPTENNINLLAQDIYNLKKANFNFENMFGNIYQKSLLSMIRTINKISDAYLEEKLKNPSLPPAETESIKKRIEANKNISEYDFQQRFLSRWKTFIENVKHAEIEVKISELLNRYAKEQGFSTKDLDEVSKAFSESLYKSTFEDINENNTGDYILEALGINVPYSKVRCKTLVLNIQQNLIKYLQDLGVKLPNGKLDLFQELATLPDESQIPYIIQYSRFLDDLFSRVADSKPDTLVSYSRKNGLAGSNVGNFTVIKYQIEIIAHQAEIRAFLNSLQAGYKDSRIYVVTKVKLNMTKDESEQIKPYDPATEDLRSQIKIMLDAPPLIDAVIDFAYIIYNRPLT